MNIVVVVVVEVVQSDDHRQERPWWNQSVTEHTPVIRQHNEQFVFLKASGKGFVYFIRMVSCC